MKKLAELLGGLLPWVWPPLAVGITSTYAFAQSRERALGVTFSLESIGVTVAIIAFIGPAFYFAGRFNQRMTMVEKDLEELTAQISGLVRVNTEAANRIACAVERMNWNRPEGTE